jgi:hypothetical protein
MFTRRMLGGNDNIVGFMQLCKSLELIIQVIKALLKRSKF